MNIFCYRVFSCVVLVFTALSMSGCSTISNFKKSQQEKKKTAETKKENFLKLQRDLADNALKKNTGVDELKAKYGTPDDLFYSGSSVSSFQVWTYNATKDKLDDNHLTAIILYLENDKLVNWKY